MGTGEDPEKANRKWELREVLDAMDNGTTFFTKSESTGKKAGVHKYECEDCGLTTIRSDHDAVEDNNLDNIRECRGWD